MSELKISLKAARVNANLTQDELAEEMGVSRTTVIQWENGKRRMKPIYLYKFCDLVNIAEDHLFMPEVTT